MWEEKVFSYEYTILSQILFMNFVCVCVFEKSFI